MNIVVVAPHMDLLTSISAELGLKFADWAKKQGHDVTVLYGMKATRGPLLMSLLRDPAPSLVYYVGHGSEDAWIGNEIFFGLVDTYNADWLNRKISATMACSTAKTLGPKVVDSGGYSYIGSAEPLYAAFNEEYHYMDDWLDYMLLLPQGLVQNKTVGEALNDLKMKAYEYSVFYEITHPDDSWDWYAFSTLSNSKSYTVIGNPDLRLSDIIQMQEDLASKMMGLLEGLQYLFRPDVLRAQWPSASKALTSFGAMGAMLGGVAAELAVEGISRAAKVKVGAEHRETAKKLGAMAGATLV